jgi:hypothetical protein
MRIRASRSSDTLPRLCSELAARSVMTGSEFLMSSLLSTIEGLIELEPAHSGAVRSTITTDVLLQELNQAVS